MRESGIRPTAHVALSDEEERIILGVRAEMASRRCDSITLAACLESLFLQDPAFTPAELNRRLDESQNTFYEPLIETSCLRSA